MVGVRNGCGIEHSPVCSNLIPNLFREGNVKAVLIPSVIYEHFQDWSQDQLASEISEVLRRPDREQSVIWAALKVWVIHLVLSDLRPDVSTSEDAAKEAAARWIAFALRYLFPLCADERRPVTGDRVLVTMQTRPNLIRLMLYGTPEQVTETLRLGLNAPVAEEFTDEANIALYVQHSAGVERTVRKWADQVSEELKRTVIRAFLDVHAGSIALSSPRLLMPAALDPLATGYRATLEWYAEHVPAVHQHQALGYLEEFKARMELAKLYLRQLTWTGFFVGLIILGLLPGALFQESSQAAALIAILTAVILVLYGLLFAYVRYVLVMAEAALKTLQGTDNRPEAR